ncbi:MAG TPA: energy-coupling factor transporter ATPase [Lachnospiraceae bacterium]|nr:energy-coupling factor transporter ATPase [Lachnospiraceae bacterium]
MPIEVKEVSCRYGERTPLEVQALKEISFRAEDGEFVGIMGHTGCGKSTLIQLIAGLLTPGEGQILIDGKDINGPGYDREELRRTLGIVFQYPESQLFETTVWRDVAFALKHLDLSREEKAERVRWVLEAVGFRMERAGKSPLSLSGGEKRRVAIAGVLAARPRILIFDEPLAGLDPWGRLEFLELAARLHRQGNTILMVSHDADALCGYADRILVLDRGRLSAQGTPEEIFGDLERAETLHIGAGEVRRIAQALYEKGRLQSPAITKYKILLGEIKKNNKGR